MKHRIRFFMAIGFLVFLLGMAWFIFSTQIQEPALTFPATINRDCAPWDGSAFTVSIPVRAGTMIDISIWQSPDIKSSVTFSFPNQTGQIGNALYRPQVGPPEELTGKVFFRIVEQGNPVAGKFDLATENGQQFKGQFEASWGDFVAYCG